MALGDRLAVERRLVGSTVTYLHHGVDMGDGTVVHARPDDPERIFGGGRVSRTSFGEFAAGAAVRVIDEPPARYAPGEVAARAAALVGRDGYCPVVENCEHFATWCATGKRSSRQIDLLVDRVGRAATRVAAVVAARGAGRVAFRTALGTSVRLGLRTLLPATLAAEGAAMAAEWSAHQRGLSPERSRRAGESAGLATSAAVCAAGALAAGPAAAITAGLAGAALWLGGSAAAEVASRARPARRHDVERRLG